MPISAEIHAYVTSRYLTLDELAREAGMAASTVARLIEAGCLSGPSYVLHEAGVRGPVGSFGSDAGPGTAYFSPILVWWIRRALAVQDSAPRDLSAALRGWYRDDLRTALERYESRAYGFTDLYADGGRGPLLEDKLEELVQRMWRWWLDGTYGVCMRAFDGSHVVIKWVERARITALTDDGRRSTFTPPERAALVDAMARLDAVITPFAPHERPTSTRGLWIDRVLAALAAPASSAAA
ncbi:MAG TPA: DUF6058 family natural product biosynthesis protein [Microvirga sp.]|nr:DUF6058 family natural product biosynthesis protein [Microvirga sp.]